MAEEQQEMTVEALKQRKKRKKRKKKAAEDAKKGIGRFTVEVAGVFMPDLKRLMKEHGLNNQQEVYQNLLRNVIAADFDTATQMLRCVTTPYVVSQKVSQDFHSQSLRILRDTACEADEVITPVILFCAKS